MIHKLVDYVQDKEFRMTILENRVHIINYQRMLSMEEERVSIMAMNKRIILKGKHLTVSKLLEDEVLIAGTITDVSIADE